MKRILLVVAGLIVLGVTVLFFIRFGFSERIASVAVLPSVAPTKALCNIDRKMLDLANQAINKFDNNILSYQAKLDKYRNIPDPTGYSMDYENFKQYVISKEPRLGEDKYASMLQEMYQKHLKDTAEIHEESLKTLNQKVNNRIIYPLEGLIKKSEERKQILLIMREKLESCEPYSDDELREIINFSNDIRTEKGLPTVTVAPALQHLYSSSNIFPTQVESEETIIQKVNRLVKLDTNEIPVLMSVSDPSKLRDQPFFSQAIIGDKILMYEGIEKVIIYRPSTDQIIEIGPLLQNGL